MAPWSNGGGRGAGAFPEPVPGAAFNQRRDVGADPATVQERIFLGHGGGDQISGRFGVARREAVGDLGDVSCFSVSSMLQSERPVAAASISLLTAWHAGGPSRERSPNGETLERRGPADVLAGSITDMMHQSAIFVDAGFLLAVGGTQVAGTSLRSSVQRQLRKTHTGILGRAKDHCGLESLRVYWYDASKDALFTDQHKKIGLLPDVKVRLGRISFNGEQKGVDLKLGLDLVGVARNRAASVAFLVSGDDDLAEAVEAAQDLGMKVVLVGLDDPSHRLGVASVAEHLALRVDSIITLPAELIESCFAKSVSAAPRPTPVAPTPGPMPARPTPGSGPRPGPRRCGRQCSPPPRSCIDQKRTSCTAQAAELQLPLSMRARLSTWHKRLERVWPSAGTAPPPKGN